MKNFLFILISTTLFTAPLHDSYAVGEGRLGSVEEESAGPGPMRQKPEVTNPPLNIRFSADNQGPTEHFSHISLRLDGTDKNGKVSQFFVGRLNTNNRNEERIPFGEDLDGYFSVPGEIKSFKLTLLYTLDSSTPPLESSVLFQEKRDTFYQTLQTRKLQENSWERVVAVRVMIHQNGVTSSESFCPVRATAGAKLIPIEEDSSSAPPDYSIIAGITLPPQDSLLGNTPRLLRIMKDICPGGFTAICEAVGLKRRYYYTNEKNNDRDSGIEESKALAKSLALDPTIAVVTAYLQEAFQEEGRTTPLTHEESSLFTEVLRSVGLINWKLKDEYAHRIQKLSEEIVRN